MTTIRAFIAIRLPAPVERALGEIAQTLSLHVPRGAVRWVRPEQIHLTLNFLGDTPVDKLPAIRLAMDATAEGRSPFSLRLGGVGCFPNERRPRVIWVGLSGSAAQLAALKSDLDERLAPLGWPLEDKPFRAHLTLGRVKDERAVQGMKWTAEVPDVEIPVAAVHLIESRLRPEGPLYTTLHTTHLSGES